MYAPFALAEDFWNDPGAIFAWNPDGVQGIWEARIAGENADQAEESPPDECEPAGMGPWPFQPEDSALVLDWSLFDVEAMVDLSESLNVNLLLMDPSGNGAFAAYPNECDWHNLARLDDALEEYNLMSGSYVGGTDLHSGGILPMLPSRTPCHWDYANQIERFRLEAADHPNVFRAVVLDETHRRVDTLENALFQTSTVDLWTSAEFESFSSMIRGNGATDPCGEPRVGAPLELWARMVHASVPRLIVPAAVVGRPACPLALEAGGACPAPGNWAFGAGDGAQVSWVIPPTSGLPVPAFGLSFGVWLEYFVNLSGEDADLYLGHRVNNQDRPAEEINAGDRGNLDIVLVEDCIGGALCSGTPVWNFGGTNKISIGLRAEGGTNKATDRLATVWAARIVFRDGPVELASYYLDPETGAFKAVGNLAVSGGTACGPETLCTTNAGQRIGDQIDGITLSHDITESHYVQTSESRPGSGEPGDPGYTNFDRFLETTCAYLHDPDNWADGQPRRCLIDERAWVANDAHLDSFSPAEASLRLGAALDHADGALAIQLPMELIDPDDSGPLESPLVGLTGRFTPDRILSPLDLRYDDGSDTTEYQFMFYEPRLSRPTVGERQWVEVTVPADPACEGDWEIYWREDVELAFEGPQYYTYGFAHRLSGPQILEDLLIQVDGDGTPASPIHFQNHWSEVAALEAGEIIEFGWWLRDDLGDVLDEEAVDPFAGSNRVFFSLVPPAGCSWDATDLSTLAVGADANGPQLAITECIAGWYRSGDAAACGL
jgi:hypothetical protein